jgi:flagellar motor switch/type III secretory pathway protein FliN
MIANFSTVLRASVVQIRHRRLGELHAGAPAMNAADVLNRFEDLPFPLAVEFGSFEISIREILELKAGSVVRTTHSAREPLTLLAGDAPIATVETLAIGQALSVRVQNILDSSAPGTAGDRQPQS